MACNMAVCVASLSRKPTRAGGEERGRVITCSSSRGRAGGRRRRAGEGSCLAGETRERLIRPDGPEDQRLVLEAAAGGYRGPNQNLTIV